MKNILQIGRIRSKFKESANPSEMKKHERIGDVPPILSNTIA